MCWPCDGVQKSQGLQPVKALAKYRKKVMPASSTHSDAYDVAKSIDKA